MARSSWHFRMSDDLRDWISQQEEKVDDWTPVMVTISEDMARFVRDDVFSTNGGPLETWKPLAASTIKRDKWKDRSSSGRPGRRGMLQSTGWMRSRTYRDASRVNAAVINDAPHAHLNEYGKTNRGGQSMSPSRGFVYVEASRGETLYPMWILDFFFDEAQ